MRVRLTSLTVAACLALVVSGCGDDGGSQTPDAAPISYSAPVVINLSAKSADVAQSTVSNEKGINAEAGNPYGAFIAAARQHLFGRDPSRIDLVSVLLVLGANSIGVTQLEEVFTGPVDVLFVMGGSDNTYPAAAVTNPTGPGPVALSVSFAYASVAQQDVSNLLSGNFKVVIRGSAATGFSTKGATADLQLTFTFAAFE